MPFEIIYTFLNEEKSYTCHVTYEQYKNFKKLPSIKECLVVKRNQKNMEEYEKEMQKALDSAVKNDTSHIRKLSENV